MEKSFITSGPGRPTKTEISLDVNPFRSKSSLITQQVDKTSWLQHVVSENSDNTGWMAELI